jgi:hypothetical protein
MVPGDLLLETEFVAGLSRYRGLAPFQRALPLTHDQWFGTESFCLSVSPDKQKILCVLSASVVLFEQA